MVELSDAANNLSTFQTAPGATGDEPFTLSRVHVDAMLPVAAGKYRLVVHAATQGTTLANNEPVGASIWLTVPSSASAAVLSIGAAGVLRRRRSAAAAGE